MDERPTGLMKRRLNIWIALGILVFMIWILINMFHISVKESKKYQELASSQQLQSTVITANRGSIYDRNMQALARSASVYTVYVDPRMLKDYLSEDEPKADLNEITAKLSEILEIGQKKILNLCQQNNMYQIIKKNVEKSVADKITAYKTEIGLDAIGLTPTTKRFYPQNELASNVIGHLHYDGYGIYGLEQYYDDYLAGVDGRVVTAKAADGTEIPYRYKQNYDAQDGDSLVLNMDVNIQYYLEKALKEAVAKNLPTDRACGIVMNPKTGAVLAMATNPSYDPNNPSDITDEDTLKTLSKLPKKSKKYAKVQSDAWALQWKNKAISELYFPGSVFKVVTGSSALDADAINLTQTFSCNTKIQVEDRSFHCWSFTSHGSQDFATAMVHSCNPAFIQIGQALGATKFYDYFKAYGFTELTGIDLPSEAESIHITKDNLGIVELASSSFGQTNKVTPIQMITAYSAVVNGGYIMTPQVVDKIIDPSGNLVKDITPVKKRQVISEKTSKIMRKVLENVVNTEQGSNAYIKGYRIGGKSGTSQKIDEDISGNTYVASYCAFYPADDPELIMLVMVDHPTGGNYYGSLVAAPVCVQVLSDVLPYLGYFPEYTDEEMEQVAVSVPNVLETKLSDAKKTIKGMGLKCEVVGKGSTVIAQSPASGSMQHGGTIYLYTENNYKAETVSVPSIKGLTVSEAESRLESVGLNLNAQGNAIDEFGAVAGTDQSYASGTKVPVGTIVSVTFAVEQAGSQ